MKPLLSGASVDTLAWVVQSATSVQPSTLCQLLLVGLGLIVVPGVLLLMTPFTRFIIVLSLLRNGLGLKAIPPNQILFGLSVILTLVVMQPTFNRVQADAVDPYLNGEITLQQAVPNGLVPMREFMLRRTARADLHTALELSKQGEPETLDEVATPVIITGYILTELRAAFVLALQVYVPLVVVDVLIGGLVLLFGFGLVSAQTVSLPVKLGLFLLVDG